MSEDIRLIDVVIDDENDWRIDVALCRFELYRGLIEHRDFPLPPKIRVVPVVTNKAARPRMKTRCTWETYDPFRMWSK